MENMSGVPVNVLDTTHTSSLSDSFRRMRLQWHTVQLLGYPTLLQDDQKEKRNRMQAVQLEMMNLKTVKNDLGFTV